MLRLRNRRSGLSWSSRSTEQTPTGVRSAHDSLPLRCPTQLLPTRPELFWPGRTDRPGTFDLIERAAIARGLTAVDINYPQQAAGISPAQMRERLG